MPNAFQTVRDFEDALCEYTGARYAVAVNSCTMALLLACAWYKQTSGWDGVKAITIPKHTYVGVPQSIMNAGYKVEFQDEEWQGAYQLNPYPIWDSARRFYANMYMPGTFQCVSFHWNKILGIGQGGAILHDSLSADQWFRRARFDGRTEGIAPKDDTFIRGWHCYMMPELAAQGLVRLHHLRNWNKDLPNDDYPDLSQQECFR